MQFEENISCKPILGNCVFLNNLLQCSRTYLSARVVLPARQRSVNFGAFGFVILIVLAD